MHSERVKLTCDYLLIVQYKIIPGVLISPQPDLLPDVFYLMVRIFRLMLVLLYISPPRWRYSPGWALASSTICLQASQFLALSLHSFIPIFLRSMDTSSSHFIFGLPLRLVACSFPYNILFGMRCLAFFLYDQAIVFFGFY